MSMSATRISLNDRFSVLAKNSVRRHRSRSRTHNIASEDSRQSPVNNLQLLNEFKKKHSMQTALKLKRRSLRTAATEGANKRLAVKSLRLAPNGRPVRTKSMTRVATMRADLVANNINRNRNSGDYLNMGTGRPTVGGAAERIARRRMQGKLARSSQRRFDGNGGIKQQQQPAERRGRSRSRSRGPNGTRFNGNNKNLNGERQRQIRGNSVRRISVKERLGVRPGNVNARNQRRFRRAISETRGVANGRIQRRRDNQNNRNNKINNVAQKAFRVVGGGARRRGRSALRAATNAGAIRRSRSRIRKSAADEIDAIGQQQGSGAGGRRGRSLYRRNGNSARGRSQSRNNGNKPRYNQKNNQRDNNNKYQQPRRGRSRSRGRGRGRKQRGKTQKLDVKKEDLDKELDTYMASTKEDDISMN